MTQQVKVLASNIDELSLIPNTHMVEGKNQFVSDMWHLHTHAVAHRPEHKNK